MASGGYFILWGDKMEGKSGIVIYRAKNGRAELEVKLAENNVWLSLSQIASLFNRSKSVISRHLSNIYREEELDKASTVAYFATVQIEGGRKIEREIEFYDLDTIISVGCRVKSREGTRFRIWARQVVKDHLIKGFSVNNNRLRELEAKFENQKETYIQLRFFLNKFLGNVARKDVVDALIEKVDGLSQNMGQIQELIKRLGKRKWRQISQ
jgi:hypothetical protein